MAEWESVTVWGTPTWASFVSPGPTSVPLSLPSQPPTASLPPTAAPPEPTLVDAFGGFDSSIWYDRCAGCSYSGGSLFVAGSDMLMRTVGTLTGLRRIEGTLVKDGACDDHALVLSTSPTLAWSWSTTAGAVKFVFNW